MDEGRRSYMEDLEEQHGKGKKKEKKEEALGIFIQYSLTVKDDCKSSSLWDRALWTKQHEI